MEKEVQIVCDKCNTVYTTNIYETIHVTNNAELKKKVISKDIFKCTCPSCNEIKRINYPTLYADEDKKILIHLVTKESKIGDLKDLDAIKNTDYLLSYTCRLVANMHELVEKVLIFESGLNDYAIETIKAIIISGRKDEYKTIRGVYFAGLMEDRIRFDVAKTDNSVQVCTIQKESYDKCYEANKSAFEKEPQEWRFVNVNWAIDYLANALKLKKERGKK